MGLFKFLKMSTRKHPLYILPIKRIHLNTSIRIITSKSQRKEKGLYFYSEETSGQHVNSAIIPDLYLCFCFTQLKYLHKAIELRRKLRIIKSILIKFIVTYIIFWIEWRCRRLGMKAEVNIFLFHFIFVDICMDS